MKDSTFKQGEVCVVNDPESKYHNKEVKLMYCHDYNNWECYLIDNTSEYFYTHEKFLKPKE